MFHVDKYKIDIGCLQNLSYARRRKLEQYVADFELARGKQTFHIRSRHLVLPGLIGPIDIGGK